MFRKILHLNKTRVFKEKFSSYLPAITYPDDVYLVSYPKSGNTWVRFLVANLLNTNRESIVDFHTIEYFVPEVIRNNDLINELNRPRIIKSHGCYIKYPKIIYIMRDGRDVYTSYYYYRRKRVLGNTTFREFLESEKHYPCLWGEHINYWLDQISSSNLLLIRYEDLIENTSYLLQEIAKFIGIETDLESIERAVQLSKFENMRKIESKRGRPYNETDSFMRRGTIGNWKEVFGNEEKNIFKKREGKVLIRSGYASDLDW
ncbi:MAG: sulfotransferase domain-containing protein [Cyanobacteria bacterium P01_E01_bin.6]